MERYAIALVSDWYPPRIGGVERQIHGLAQALGARGHDVRVVTTARGGEDKDNEGVPVRRIDLPLFARGDVARPGPELIRRLRHWLSHDRVDVVHAHGTFSPTAHGGVIVGDELGVASVFTSHSLLRPALRPLARLIFLGCGYRADVVSAVSEAAAVDARRFSRRDDVRILSNGIDLETARGPSGTPGRDEGADGAIRIVSVMRLVPKKTPSALVAAVPHVLARVPEPSRVRFVVVGDGSERTRLEAQARRLGVEGHVEFIGSRPPADVPRLLRGAHIFASPVRDEAFGIAVLEARAAGLPVVAMAGGGVAEIVTPGCHGFLAATPREFVDALARLVSDADLRRMMSDAAPTDLERFGWDAVVERHLDAYRHAIAQRGGRRRRAWR
jgi:glycosyltransferase involved in cell wall biosynthesis